MTHAQDQAMRALNATNALDLAFWAESDLWKHSHNAAVEFCTSQPAMAEVFADITVAPETSEIALDARCVTPLAVFHKSTDAGTAIIREASRTTLPNLEALGNWQAKRDQFLKEFAEWKGAGTLIVHPAMPAGRTVAAQVIGSAIPAVMSSGNPVINLPEALRPYLNLRTVAAARDHEGPARMPEVAAAFRELADMIGGALGATWGA